MIGKHQEASHLCQNLGLQKWAILFDQDRNMCQNVITEDKIESYEPSIDTIEELDYFKTMFSLQRAPPNSPSQQHNTPSARATGSGPGRTYIC